jgi:hypothetical protein
MRRLWFLTILVVLGLTAEGEDAPPVLRPDAFAHYVDKFNSMEDENVANMIPNAKAREWMSRNVPTFECPDKDLEEIYWYRWWTYRKHIRQMPDYVAITEFLTYKNPVSSAVGHHIMEGRWIHDNKYLDQDLLYWLRGSGGKPHDIQNFSSWTVWAAYQRYLVNQDRAFIVGMLDDFVRDYRGWEEKKLNSEGLFWQYDSRDAMEESISGSRTAKNARPSISSYMFGNALAIAAVADLAGKRDVAERYRAKAMEIQRLVQEKLWDPKAGFFKVRFEDGTLSDAREEIGFIPWYFDLPALGYEAAWGQFIDPQGFWAPFGITTAERRHPKFRTHGCCHCEWDGAVWPFATSQTLTAMANLLNHYGNAPVNREHYLEALRTYAKSQHRHGRPYIGEYLDEKEGTWLKGDAERSRYYNHSTFCDLIITGLVGVRPRADDTVEVSPLLPEGAWEWFCLDDVRYHGRTLTILWDRTGQRYGRGPGLTVLADGKPIGHSTGLQRLTGKLN